MMMMMMIEIHHRQSYDIISIDKTYIPSVVGRAKNRILITYCIISAFIVIMCWGLTFISFFISKLVRLLSVKK